MSDALELLLTIGGSAAFMVGALYFSGRGTWPAIIFFAVIAGTGWTYTANDMADPPVFDSHLPWWIHLLTLIGGSVALRESVLKRLQKKASDQQP